MIRLRLLAAALLFMLPVSPASAWWDYGHRTVAKIAWTLVTPQTRAAIRHLLARQALLETSTCPARTIEEASLWADCIKTLGDRFSYAYAWHFQDVDICRPFDLTSPCAGGNCVSKQIERAERMLADRALPERDRIEALAFLVHFVGDLHQPLHAGEHRDRGGNEVKAGYGIRPSNLHAIWDGLLADRAISTPPADAAGILGEVPAADRARIAAGSVEDWSRESWGVAKDVVYPSVIADPCGPPPAAPPRMDEATIERLIPVLRAQIAKGGIRLARLLDEAFAAHGTKAGGPRAASASPACSTRLSRRTGRRRADRAEVGRPASSRLAAPSHPPRETAGGAVSTGPAMIAPVPREGLKRECGEGARLRPMRPNPRLSLQL